MVRFQLCSESAFLSGGLDKETCGRAQRRALQQLLPPGTWRKKAYQVLHNCGQGRCDNMESSGFCQSKRVLLALHTTAVVQRKKTKWFHKVVSNSATDATLTPTMYLAKKNCSSRT